MVGVTMLLTVLGLSLTGYLLPWDTKAYWATSVTIQIAAGSPIIGGLLQAILLGGPTLGPSTLLRFFTFHVFLLPGLVILLMYIHFKLIRKHGISEPL
jgi:menaquinol-cytochrome c reductase cytochrome b subunit